jgi:3-deoxy-manno-octulosonate cytidylyltransferase (CMP-KDO synthetase)
VRLLCVIPARLGSTRLPHKPLRLLGGEPLIRVVARRALELDLGGPVVVASDHPAVLQAVGPLAVAGVLTGPHSSGTERVAAVVRRPEYLGADLVLNLQGDEPFLPREAAVGAVGRVLAGDDVGTAAQPLSDGAWRDPRRVKVEIDRRGRARRFFRTPDAPACGKGWPTFQHMGVYAYRPDALARWMTLPPAADEAVEGLEQLRPLMCGMTIGVATVTEPAPHGIDTEDDLRTAEALL